MKSKIREIIEKYAEHIEQTNKFSKFKSIPKFVSSDDFDKLEEDLQKHYDNKSPLDYIKPRWNTKKR